MKATGTPSPGSEVNWFALRVGRFYEVVPAATEMDSGAYPK